MTAPLAPQPLALQGEGDAWRLRLNGDWSLAAVASIEARLKGLPGSLRGTLVCDWSGAEAPGIGPVWALLIRLAELGATQLEITHVGDPPHFLDLLPSSLRNCPAAWSKGRRWRGP